MQQEAAFGAAYISGNNSAPQLQKKNIFIMFPREAGWKADLM